MDSPINFDTSVTNNSIKDLNYWTTYIGDLFTLVKFSIEPVTHFDKLIIEKQYSNVPQIHLNKTPEVLNSVLPSPRLVAPLRLENPYYFAYSCGAVGKWIHTFHKGIRAK